MVTDRNKRWRCYVVGYELHAEEVEASGAEEAKAIILGRLRVANWGLEHRQHLFEGNVVCEPVSEND